MMKIKEMNLKKNFIEKNLLINNFLNYSKFIRRSKFMKLIHKIYLCVRSLKSSLSFTRMLFFRNKDAKYWSLTSF